MSISSIIFRVGHNESLRYGNGTNGAFFTYNPKTERAGSTYGCREELCRYAFRANTRFIGFSGAKVNIESFNRFWTYIEHKLGLTETTIIHPTDMNTAIVLEIPSFWAANSTVRSLFSLLLRAGGAHYMGSLDKSLDEYVLARRCKAAVYHFLDGNTAPASRSVGYGFVETYAAATEEQMKEMLRKPAAT